MNEAHNNLCWFVSDCVSLATIILKARTGNISIFHVCVDANLTYLTECAVPRCDHKMAVKPGEYRVYYRIECGRW